MEPEQTKPSMSFHRRNWRWILGLAGVALLTPHTHGQYDPDWERNFRLGLLVGFNVKSSFRLSGNALNVSGNPGIYNDGYVIADPKNLEDDYTSNWGYNSDSQYDAANHTLTLSRTTSFSPDSASKTSKSDGPFLGFDMEYGGYPWRWERFRLGWTFGFGLLPIETKDTGIIQGTVTTTDYAFDTGSHVLFPPGGYQGNADGGPAIHSEQPDGVPGETSPASVSGTRSLDVILYSFRLGPTLFFDLNDKIGLSIGAGPAVGIVSGDYKYDETIAIGSEGTETSSNKGRFSDTDFLFGGYVNATITYHATENGDFYVGAQYMPLGSSTFSKGGREAKLDLSGAIYLSAGINWPF